MVLQVYYLKNKLLSMTFENDLSEFAKNISIKKRGITTDRQQK